MNSETTMKLMAFPGDAYSKLGKGSSGEDNSFSCSFKEVLLPPITDRRKIGRKGRLLERPSVNSDRNKKLGWVSEDKSHRTRYLQRLTRLRDQLMDEEETNLARALGRLRLRQMGKDENSRVRVKDSGAGMLPSRRRSMMTTLEKFKRMRPQKDSPRLFPLEGKQLIEPKKSERVSVFNPELSEAKPLQISEGIDDVVDRNLQRLNHPSIPNIGRRATKREEFLVHSQGLDRKTSKNSATRIPHSVSHGAILTPLTRRKQGDVDLSPESVKLEPLIEGDGIDMDKLRQYYYIYYLPSTNSQVGELSTRKPSKNNRKSRRTQSNASSQKAVSCSNVDVKTCKTDSVAETEANMWSETVTSQDDVDVVSESTSRDHEVVTDRSTRMRIVVDMPDIIYSAPTPDIIDVCEIERSGVLTKTYKQNELRERELQNLIDDVRELNMRTKSLSGEL